MCGDRGFLRPPMRLRKEACQQNRPGEWVFQDPKAIASLMCLWRNRAEVQRLFDSSRRDMPAEIVFVLADSRASEPATRLRCQVVAVGT